MSTHTTRLMIGGMLAVATAVAPVTIVHASAGATAVGDKCLVGTFRVKSAALTFKLKKSTLRLAGGSGAVERISASGVDKVDFNGSKAFSARYKGHVLKGKLSGSGTSSIRANHAHTKVTSGKVTSAHGIRTVATYDGNTQKTVEHHQAGSTEHYTCSSQRLVETTDGGHARTVEVRVSRTR